jgi:hypothetical protein
MKPVWSQVEGYVARNNTSFKLKEIRSLLETVEHTNCVQNAEKEDDYFDNWMG